MKITKTKQVDSLVNLVTSMNSGTDRLQQSVFSPQNFFGYQELVDIYEGWLGRRIVDLLPKESLKRGWDIYCPSWEPDKINLLKKYDEHLGTKELLLSALKSERIFGGSLIVALTNATWGAMRNPIPDYLPHNSLLCLRMFDAWQAYAARINFMNPLADDFLMPITYTIGSAGIVALKQTGVKDEELFLTGAIVHHSRVERFGGEFLPWYERQRNLYWGQSILSNVYEAVRNAGIVDSAIASLLFRASVPVLSVDDLLGIVADDEATAAFLKRVNLMNYQMSNNNMAIIDTKEKLENFEVGAFSGLDQILERFYTTVSAATGYPVTKLVGTSAKGLDATGEGDMNNYYDMIEEYQSSGAKPHLMSLYRRWIVPSLFNENLPADFDVVFPALERVSPEKKMETDRQFLDMLTASMDNKIIDLKIARKEVMERKIFNNLTKGEIERLEKETGANEVDLVDAMDVADELERARDGVYQVDPEVAAEEANKDNYLGRPNKTLKNLKAAQEEDVVPEWEETDSINKAKKIIKVKNENN